MLSQGKDSRNQNDSTSNPNSNFVEADYAFARQNAVMKSTDGLTATINTSNATIMRIISKFDLADHVFMKAKGERMEARYKDLDALTPMDVKGTSTFFDLGFGTSVSKDMNLGASVFYLKRASTHTSPDIINEYLETGLKLDAEYFFNFNEKNLIQFCGSLGMPTSYKETENRSGYFYYGYLGQAEALLVSHITHWQTVGIGLGFRNVTNQFAGLGDQNTNEASISQTDLYIPITLRINF